MLLDNFQRYSRYNQWMNTRLYDCAAQLDPALFSKDLGAFFGSILGTLNHLLVADLFWMRRFALHPLQFSSLDYIRQHVAPTALNQILHEELDSLRRDREQVDLSLIAFCAELDAAALDSVLLYQDTQGNSHSNKMQDLLQHVFNHQTHHRGQTTTLFHQCGLDVGVTDLMYLIRQENQDQGA